MNILYVFLLTSIDMIYIMNKIVANSLDLQKSLEILIIFLTKK